jgi:methyltransferase (TIGR00027 family)
MDEKFGGGFSNSALTAAAARAAHLIVDKEPYIFADTLASALLGDQAEELLSFHRLHGDHAVLSGARAQAASRSRYAEDRLAAAVGNGVRQYLILGAGLDTFAYRSPLAGAVRVIEVDHPATQDWKRRALTAAGIAVPPGVAFVPADLAAGGLDEVLRHAPLDLASPVFVSWLGVVMYLVPADVAATLRALGGLAPGTEVVADYLLAPGLRDEAGHRYAELVGRASAERAEPWLSSFEPEELTAIAAAAGFGAVRHAPQRDTVPAALWERDDAVATAEAFALLHATVTPARRSPRSPRAS